MFSTVFSPKKSFFWLAITGLAITSGIFTHRYFTQSYPIISLSISMTREEALAKAHQLSTQHAWLPLTYHAAVEFKHDQLLHYFVELECGGKEAFSQLLHTKECAPYQWHVRHFQEKTTHETSIFFTPDGIPYGFTFKLPETEIRPTLTAQEARELAQTMAIEEWNISFDHYKEIEASKDLKPCGRLNHSFIYERTDKQLGAEGKYRLKLVVSGDTVSEITHFVFIPEAFKRRFHEMRSSNTTVLTCGTLGLQILYLFAGCFLAGFFFVRKRFLHITPALWWASFFGFLMFASLLNELPQAWISYDTATSTTSFLCNYLLKALAQSIITTALFTTIFSAAVTWDQLAFPSRLAFWKVWTPTVGASQEVMGRTVGGYIFSVFFLGSMTAIYRVLTGVFHWWCPADTLVNPTILATYAPWITPFSQAASAGFVEEILFRAVPLAACIVLGRYYKREKLSSIFGFILQALIFAACHASYPQSPGYFRLVELLIPSSFLGGLYLYFGLLPGIIAHFLFDFFFMSLPLFATPFSQAFVSKSIVITLFFSPLLVVLYQRLRYASWYRINPAKDYNESLLRSHHPSPLSSTPPAVTPSFPENSVVSKIPGYAQKILCGAGILGLVVWIWCTPFTSTTPPLTISKNDALSRANESFTEQEVPTPPDFLWKPYCFIASIPTQSEFFVWRTQGEHIYRSLLGSYLTPPSWAVRYLSFSGSLVDRALEFTSIIGPEGTVLRNNLIFPESYASSYLQEGEARRIALEALQTTYELPPTDLKELSATPQERTQRRDWTFVFCDKKVSLAAEGEARIQVTIAGDKVANIHRFVFVPEAWLRTQQQTDLYRALFNFFIIFIKALAFFSAFIILYKSLFQTFSVKKIILWASLLIPLVWIANLNELDQLLATALTTSRPYEAQLFTFLAALLVTPAILMTALSILLSSLKNVIVSRSGNAVILYAIAAEVALQGTMQTILYVQPHYLPFIPDYANFNTYSPLVGLGCTTFISLFQTTALELICIAGFTKVMHSSPRPWIYGALFFIVSTLSYCHPLLLYPSTVLLVAILLGTLFTGCYFLLLRYDQRALIIMVATRLTLATLQQGLQQTYPHLLLYAIIVSSSIMLVSAYWFITLSRKD
jgi:hypothetical protein